MSAAFILNVLPLKFLLGITYPWFSDWIFSSFRSSDTKEEPWRDRSTFIIAFSKEGRMCVRVNRNTYACILMYVCIMYVFCEGLSGASK
jgi:hypothetical protein